MNSVLKKDFKRLMMDTLKAQACIELLAQGSGANTSEGRKRDMMQLASRIVHLDFDLRTMLLDCAILGRRYWKAHNLPLINSLHYSLEIIVELLNDLNGMEPAVRKKEVKSLVLQQFQTDWMRFKRSVRDMQASLQYFHMRRKSAGWRPGHSTPVRGPAHPISGDLPFQPGAVL